MEKWAVDQMADFSARRTDHMIGALIRSPLWLGGFGAGIVVIVPASRLYLGEHLGKRGLGGLAVIIAAIVLVSVVVRLRRRFLVARPEDDRQWSHRRYSRASLLALRRTSTDASIVLGAACGLTYGIASIQSKSASVLLENRSLAQGVVRVVESPYPYAFRLASLLGRLIFQSGPAADPNHACRPTCQHRRQRF
jgi:hypothetical protein